MSVQVFGLFKIRLFEVCLILSMVPMYLLDIDSLHIYAFENTSSPHEENLFTLLIISLLYEDF